MDIPRRHTTRREFLAGVASGAALVAAWPASSAATTTLTPPSALGLAHRLGHPG